MYIHLLTVYKGTDFVYALLEVVPFLIFSQHYVSDNKQIVLHATHKHVYARTYMCNYTNTLVHFFP